MYYYNLIPKIVLVGTWDCLKYKAIASQRLRYIECNPYYYNMLDIIEDTFPEVKFVFVVRHPQSFIISHIGWVKQRWQSTIANRLIPLWQPVPFLDQIRGIKNDYHKDVEFFCRVWVNKNNAILKNEMGNEKLRILRFEDLFHPEIGLQIMSDLLEWLNLSVRTPISKQVLTQKMNVTRGVYTHWWDDECTEILTRFCSPLMIRFGYQGLVY